MTDVSKLMPMPAPVSKVSPAPEVSHVLKSEDLPKAVSEVTDKGSGYSLKTIDKLAEIPLVEATVGKGKELYVRVKASNSLLEWGFNTAEKITGMVFTSVKPLLTKLEAPIKLADNVAVEGISTLEKRIPIIRQPPHKIFRIGVDRVRDAVAPVYSRFHYFVEDGKSKINSTKAYVDDKLKGVVTYADSAMDSVEEFVQALYKDLDVEMAEGPASLKDSPSQTVKDLAQRAARISLKVAKCCLDLVVGAGALLVEELPYLKSLIFVQDKTVQPETAVVTSSKPSN